MIPYHPGEVSSHKVNMGCWEYIGKKGALIQLLSRFFRNAKVIRDKDFADCCEIYFGGIKFKRN